MAEIFDYQKHTGTLERWDYDPMTGTAYINRKQDLRLWHKVVAEARNAGLADKGIIDGGREMLPAYSIPVEVQIELKNRGIDIYSQDPEMIKRFVYVMETEYPKCKVNNKRLHLPEGAKR